MATIPVGQSPHRVAITPDGAFAYVTIGSSNTVSVIRTSDNMIVNTFPVGVAPFGIAITPLLAAPEPQDVVTSGIGTMTDAITAASGDPAAEAALQDILDIFLEAQAELNETPPDVIGALNDFKDAAKELETVITAGQMDPDQGQGLIDLLVESAEAFAVKTIAAQDLDPAADPVLIAAAKEKLEKGRAKVADGDFEKAIQLFRGSVVEALRATGKLPPEMP